MGGRGLLRSEVVYCVEAAHSCLLLRASVHHGVSQTLRCTPWLDYGVLDIQYRWSHSSVHSLPFSTFLLTFMPVHYARWPSTWTETPHRHHSRQISLFHLWKSTMNLHHQRSPHHGSSSSLLSFLSHNRNTPSMSILTGSSVSWAPSPPISTSFVHPNSQA